MFDPQNTGGVKILRRGEIRPKDSLKVVKGRCPFIVLDS